MTCINLLFPSDGCVDSKEDSSDAKAVDLLQEDLRFASVLVDIELEEEWVVRCCIDDILYRKTCVCGDLRCSTWIAQDQQKGPATVHQLANFLKQGPFVVTPI